MTDKQQATLDAEVYVCDCGKHAGLNMLLPYIFEATVKELGLKNGERVKVTIRKVKPKPPPDAEEGSDGP